MEKVEISQFKTENLRSSGGNSCRKHHIKWVQGLQKKLIRLQIPSLTQVRAIQNNWAQKNNVNFGQCRDIKLFALV